MSQLKSEYLTAAGTKKIRSTTVTPGTKYPRRTLFVSGPSPRGRVQTTTVDNGTITANGLNVSQACGGVNKTRNIVFDTDYNQFSDSQTPPYVFEHTVVHRQADGTTLSRADQQLLQGSTLNLYPLTSNFSRSGVESTSIGFGSVNPITTPVSGNLNVTIPTTISAEEWERLLSDEPKFDSAVQSDSNRVTLNMAGADQVRCAPVSTGFPDTTASASDDLSGGQVQWLDASQPGVTELSPSQEYKLNAGTSLSVNLVAESNSTNTTIGYSATDSDVVSLSRSSGETNSVKRNSTTIRPIKNGNTSVFVANGNSSDSIQFRIENTAIVNAIVFTNSAGEIFTLKDGRNKTTYTPPNINPKTIGPITSGVDGRSDTDIEVPFVTDRNKLRIVSEDRAPDTLADNAKNKKSLLAVGEFNGSDTSVFYVNSSTKSEGDIRRANSAGQAQVFDFTPNEGGRANAILGISDIDSDDSSELIFAGTKPGGSSNVINYLNEDDGTTESIPNSGVSTDSSRGIGTPADFNGDGNGTVPIVDGSNNIKLLDANGKVKTIKKENEKVEKAPVATTDIDRDGTPEIVYVKSGDAPDQQLKYIDNVRSDTPKIKIVRNATGVRISASPDRGVA